MPASLHTHSWYSLLEGVNSPESLLERAAACSYTALALTDTNNLYGAVAFVEQAHRHGVRPILGACLRQQRQRCVVLIAEQSGYRSLCRILSRLHLALGSGQSEVPSTEYSVLGTEYSVLGTGYSAVRSEELLPTTCCPLPTSLADLLCADADGLHVLTDDLALAERLRDAFGTRLWLEVVRPPLPPLPRGERGEEFNSPSVGTRGWEEFLALGRRLGLRLVASTATHFATPAEYPTYRLVTAVRRITLLDQLPDRLPIAPDHHLVDPATLRHRFRDLPEAVRNTDLLAEQLRSDVLPRDVILPPPRVPRSLDAVRYLRLLCERGLRCRDLGDNLDARQRLRDELAVIEAGNLAGYFLVVRDIARYARRQRYGMALRGSAGNSLVCFLLEITDVDPLRFRLPLERFLHPGRADLPDIDLDFDWKVRDYVLAHVFRRYGPVHTAMISSHLFLQPRSAFREAAKIHGLSNEQISALLETLSSRVDSLLKDEGRRMKDEPKSVPSDSSFILHPSSFPLEAERWPRILTDARRLLGRPHHLSIHPGGVVITPRPIEDYVPLQRAPKGIIITQFDKDAAEHIGLVKIDLLGNRALSTVDEAKRLGMRNAECGMRNKRNSGDLSLRIPHSAFRIDEATAALLQHGDTLGVNQLESPAMRHLLIQMRPQGLDDVIQALAMIRPGAASVGMKECFIRRRRGLEPVRYAHPSLEPLLRETQGLMLYEDDALGVVQALTGLAAPEADRFRKRVAKHQTEDQARALAAEFVQACARHGVPRAVAAEQWVQLAKFNHYSFCKSHAVSYGLIAWTAASLKTHHPLPFWTAALNNNQGMYPRRVYVEAIKRAGIPLRLPCVNRSAGPFAVEGDAIRVGLDAIASLDSELRAALLADRQRRGPYRDLADLRRRVALGPEALSLLIRCGALDGTGRSRPALFLEAELQDRGQRTEDRGRRTEDGGQRTEDRNGEQRGWLFPDSWLLTPDSWGWSPANYDAGRRLRDEWELLGFIVGPRLLSLFRPELPRDCVISRELSEYVGRSVRVAGVVATARHTPMADGRTMQFVTLEDEWGLIEVTLFPGSCPLVAYLSLGPYVATGVVEEQYGVLTVTARSFRLYKS
jgi:DNA-directed DNA polymerase III PolC